MTTKVKPLSNRVLVKRVQAPTSKSGILLPTSSKNKPNQGEVISTGPGLLDDKGNILKMEVQVGDKVLFGAYSGTPLSGEDDLIIMTEDEILAVVN
ncbi:MAG: co-chaperone GroES [Rhabdochlamydiaceae bacterium]|nr:co-chaperone GroES [Candidatus Amphrikana amoebophyrae]